MSSEISSISDPNDVAQRLGLAAALGLFTGAVAVLGWYEWSNVQVVHHLMPLYSLVPVVFEHLSAPYTQKPFLIGAILGGILGWRLSYRSPVRHIRGQRLTSRTKGLGEPDADGVFIHPQVRLTEQQETAHIMFLGGSGSGKTSILWSILNQARERGDKILILSIKGDWQESWPTAGKGVALLAPWDARSAHWQVGRDIQTVLDADSFCESLVPIPESGDPFWATGARAVLGAVVNDIQSRARGGAWTMGDLWGECAKLLAEDFERLRAIVTQVDPVAAAGFLAEEPGESKMTASFIAQISAGLRNVKHLAAAERYEAQRRPGRPLRLWSVAAWLTGRLPPVAIIGYQASARGLSGTWAAAIIEQAVRQVLDLPDAAPSARRIWLVLDEVVQVGEIPSITQALELARSKGLRVVLGVQSTSQIAKRYDQHTRQIWAGSCGTKIICRVKEPDDQAWASSLLGDREVERFQSTRNRVGGGPSTTSEAYVRVREPVMAPAEFGQNISARHLRIRNKILVRAVLITQRQPAILTWTFPVSAKFRPATVTAGWLVPAQIQVDRVDLTSSERAG